MREVQSTPKLRFPEFENRWQTIILDQMSSRVGDGIHGTPKYDDDGDYFFINGNNLCNGRIEIDKATKKVSKEERQKHHRELNDRTILVSINGTIGNLAYYNNEPVMLGKSAAYINILPEYNLEYVFNYISTSKIQAYFYTSLTGSTIKNLSLKAIREAKIKIPISTDEQQKIAAFLSSVDQRIHQLTKKKDLLEEYKKGVMQKIFSQEIRFKDENGEAFPDWEERRLGDIAIKINTKNRDAKIKDVLTNSATEGIVNQREYFDKDIANMNNLKGYYVVHVNDFVYNPRISTNAPVGPINRNRIHKGVMSPLYTVFRFAEITLTYFEYFFKTNIWHKHMSSVANYGARHDRMNITQSDFFRLPIPVPSRIEQHKIATFLSAIDTKIDRVDQQITKTQTFKKGLLQQMFV